MEAACVAGDGDHYTGDVAQTRTYKLLVTPGASLCSGEPNYILYLNA